MALIMHHKRIKHKEMRVVTFISLCNKYAELHYFSRHFCKVICQKTCYLVVKVIRLLIREGTYLEIMLREDGFLCIHCLVLLRVNLE